MSLRCEVKKDCTYEIEFECTSANRVYMCNQHIRAHANGCGCLPHFIGNNLITQAAEVSEAISHLKELRAKVRENNENLIQIIQQTSNILMSSLESMEKILDEIQFGTAWDPTKIESIKGLKLEDISLENFKSTIKKIVNFKEALHNKKFNSEPVAVIPEPVQKKPKSLPSAIPTRTLKSQVSLSVVPLTLQQKAQLVYAIGVSSDTEWVDIQEIHFTQDGEFAFICNLYADCKFYKGI